MTTDQLSAIVILWMIVMAYTLHKLPTMITLIKAWIFRKSHEQKVQEDLIETEDAIRNAQTIEEIESIATDAVIWYTMLGPSYKIYYDRLQDVLFVARIRIKQKGSRII